MTAVTQITHSIASHYTSLFFVIRSVGKPASSEEPTQSGGTHAGRLSSVQILGSAPREEGEHAKDEGTAGAAFPKAEAKLPRPLIGDKAGIFSFVLLQTGRKCRRAIKPRRFVSFDMCVGISNRTYCM